MLKKTGTNAPNIKKPEVPMTNRHYVLENPYDLAPVETIIWQAIQEEIRDKDPEQSLIVLMGEIHTIPTHKLPQAGLLTHLAQWRDEKPDDPERNFVFSYEAPYNTIEVFGRLNDHNIPEDFLDEPFKHDPYGTIGAVIKIAQREEHCWAPLSMQYVFNTCINQCVDLCFSDAASQSIGGFRILDPKDPIAARVAKNEYGTNLNDQDISSRSSEGIAIRNAVMTERALDFSTMHNAQIIVQHCGAHHLYGYHSSDDKFEDSLVARFNKAGCKTLAVTFLRAHEGNDTLKNIAAEDVWQSNQNHIIIEGLSDKACYLGYMRSLFNMKASRKEERFINKLVDNYSGKNCPFTINNLTL